MSDISVVAIWRVPCRVVSEQVLYIDYLNQL